MARQAQEAKSDMGRAVATGVLLLPVVIVLLPTCLVMAVNMVPTAVAYLVDRSRGKSLVITVGLPNFCGALPAAAEVWSEGQAFDASLMIATDPVFWMFSYGAAALGWLIYLGFPPILTSYYTISTEARARSLRRRQKSLVAAWGEEVAGEAAPELKD